MQKGCSNHPEAEFITECNTCKKRLCKDCVIVTSDSTFCSIECKLLYYKEKPMPKETMKRIVNIGWVLLFILTLSFACMVLINALAQRYDEFRKLDLIGAIIEFLQKLKK